ncbi:PREDICTED: type 2 phosphatidylinositol 4,5-bisphosphate 4-phosphatase-like, partial [Cariama cristata]|uniref:type 2 phosphatidylinositol 4,5-bisphosphate 4-phosphatase-like n=1 Tax=Cariama cristata TaxID=54380 RepID=UPI000520BEAB
MSELASQKVHQLLAAGAGEQPTYGQNPLAAALALPLPAKTLLFPSSKSQSWFLQWSAELPPPYTAIASPDASGVPVINCRVCQSLINLDGKLHQHVVKCTVCNEATPIKNPPSGKKYVRCQCNCLLICKDTSRKIGCPRPNCRRIITLGPVMLIPEEQPAQPALPVQPDGTRVVCGHCGNTFLWMELRFNTLAKCPHCKK